MMIAPPHILKRMNLSPDTLLKCLYVSVLISICGLVFSIAVSSIAFGAASLFWVLLLVIYPERVEMRNSIVMFFLLYVVVDFLSSIFSIDAVGSFIGMKRLALFFNIYYTMSVAGSSKRILHILIAFVTAVSLASLIELITGKFAVSLSERLAIFQNYMTEGGIKMFALLITLPLLIHRETSLRLRVWFTLLLLPISFALVLTQTRSSWIGAIGGIIVIGLLKEKKAIVALLVVIIVFALFAPHPLQVRAMSIFDTQQTSNLARIHMAKTGLKIFRDFPILGTGDVDLHALYVHYTKPIDPGEGGHLHNNIIQALVTLGAVGFLVLMALYAAIGQSLWKMYKVAQSSWLYGSVCLGGVAAYAGFHLNGLFEYNFGDHEIAAILWFVIGLCYSAGHLCTAEQQKNMLYTKD